MMNLSLFSHFILGAYVDSGPLKYLYFILITLLYIVIIFANTLLILVICTKRSLHEPMYLFLCSLFVNQLYGSTALFPSLMIQVVSDIHTVSISCCFLQIFCLHTYGSIEFNILAIMSYDRYLAICYPLQYHAQMTPNKVHMFIAFIWVYSFLKFLITLSLNIRLPRCGNIIDQVYCQNYYVVKLACSDTKLNNLYGLFGICISVLVPIIPILFSYMKILRICLNGSNETRQKAVTTCVPHLASLLNFSFGCVFQLVQSRFDMTHVPAVVRIILSLYFLICQPIFNPIIYGVMMSKIRKMCIGVLFCEI